MQRTQLGRTGLSVSRLCLGTMTFGLQCEEPVSRAIMDTAAEGGIDFFDTADVYPLGGGGNTVGRTEEIVGAWLVGKRHDYIVATKCVGRTGRRAWDQGMSRKHILDAIDASLKRLQTDYVDLYQLHGYDGVTPIDEALDALDTVVRSGKARYVGVSNWPATKIARAVGRIELKNWAGIASAQPRYNLIFRTFERDLLPLCREEGIGVIPYNPLAGGMLTGKHAKGSSRKARDLLGTAGARYQERYWHDREFDERRRQLKGRGRAKPGSSMATMAVSWVLAQQGGHQRRSSAPAALEQLADSLAAAEAPMAADLKAKLDDLTHEWRAVDAER